MMQNYMELENDRRVLLPGDRSIRLGARGAGHRSQFVILRWILSLIRSIRSGHRREHDRFKKKCPWHRCELEVEPTGVHRTTCEHHEVPLGCQKVTLFSSR